MTKDHALPDGQSVPPKLTHYRNFASRSGGDYVVGHETPAGNDLLGGLQTVPHLLRVQRTTACLLPIR